MSKFYFPQRLHTADGSKRRVGYELEFAGVELELAAELAARSLDAGLEKISEAVYLAHSDRFGKFRIELDWSFAKDIAEQRIEEGVTGPAGGDKATEVDDPTMKWVTRLAGTVVPIEIVCPPIAIDELEALNEMANDLRAAGALGTEHSLLYAFGLHLNPELPALDAATISAFVQGFIIAEQWLTARHRVDFSRRVTPYIDVYPDRYAALVMSYPEAPTIGRLIDDYLTYNPTRNRALDLLPLFKHIDAPRVKAVVDDPRVNARPTFHYRLPNCEIERSDWTLSESWNLWCVVEHIAANDTLRHELITQWRNVQDNLLNLKDNPWHQRLDEIHRDLLSG